MYNERIKIKGVNAMDMQKMGAFLKELRTERQLTQEQLGEKLGVTNKTVSRWETGKYMPPVECLEMLSDMYSISINELLSGGRLNQEDYVDSAEKNLKSTLSAMEDDTKKFEKMMFVILIITTVLAMIGISILPINENMTTVDTIRQFIVMAIIIALAFFSNTINMVAIALKKGMSE